MFDLTVFTLRRWRNVSREDAKKEKRACAQTSRVESNKGGAATCWDQGLCVFAYRSTPRPACCGLFSFCKDFILCSI